jgi:pSer/pThr/pTyr-binding forkhead associated (FHA) protein
MANEYKPTRKVNQSGGQRSYQEPSRNQPTIQKGAQERRRAHNHAGRASANKTINIRREEPPTFAWFVLVEGIHAGKIFRLHSDVTLIGRDPSCDIVLDDQAISRQHVKIRSDEGDEDEQVFVLHDLATENGTFVNDEEVLKHELSDGDHVRMGRTQMVFKQVQP